MKRFVKWCSIAVLGALCVQYTFAADMYALLRKNPIFSKMFWLTYIPADTNSNRIDIVRQDYRDIDSGIVDNGDNEFNKGVYYVLEDGVITTKGSTKVVNNESTDLAIVYKVDASKSDLVEITSFGAIEDRTLSFRYMIRPEDGSSLYISEDSKGFPDVIRAGTMIEIWDDIKRYENKQQATYTLTFQDSQMQVQVRRPNGRVSGQDTYQDGVLIERSDYINNLKYVYTITNGQGLLKTMTLDGKVTDTAKLERKKDENGCLVYEKVRYNNRRGYITTISYRH